MGDDGFHGVLLSSKQLVFLFMAATVAAVVIFLCGVLVGRGVQAEKGSGNEPAPALLSPPQTVGDAAGAETSSAGPAPGAVGSAASAEDLSYYQRLQGDKEPPETLQPRPGSGKDASGAGGKPKVESGDDGARADAAPVNPEAPPEPSDARQASSPPAAGQKGSPSRAGKVESTIVLPTEPNTQGFAVQVAAVRSAEDADAMVKRLRSHGFSPYVLPPGSGSPAAIYRVRVGKFKERREAEQVARRLEKEEQYKPWITR